MKLTPAIKGQLTKAIRKHADDTEALTVARPDIIPCLRDVASIFRKIMPREQAKHAARKLVTGACLILCVTGAFGQQLKPGDVVVPVNPKEPIYVVKKHASRKRLWIGLGLAAGVAAAVTIAVRNPPAHEGYGHVMGGPIIGQGR